MSTSETEPLESDGSSKDDAPVTCWREGCGHPMAEHEPSLNGARYTCFGFNCQCPSYMSRFRADATPHAHKWGPWAPYSPICSEPLAPMEKAVCACGADKVRRAEMDHEDACPVRTGEEGPRRGMCLCHVEKEAPKAPEAEVPPTPRPPYAVAYAVQGGALYEVALPGDATAAAEGGRLVITHSGMPVTGIVRVAPMRIEEGA